MLHSRFKDIVLELLLSQMVVRIGKTHRNGKISVRDALVFVVIALVALALIEALILSNAAAPSPPADNSTVTLTRTVHSLSTSTSTATSTVTSVSNSTYTVTPSDVTTTETVTNTSTDTETSTSFLTNTTISISTSTQTVTSDSTSTSTSTTTTTSTSTTTFTATPTGPFVAILPGASSNQSSSGYSPDTIVVVLGVNSTVTWINYDSEPHTVTSTSQAEPFNSGDIAPGGSFTLTFLQTGTFSYGSVNSPWMNGTVIVKSENSGT